MKRNPDSIRAWQRRSKEAAFQRAKDKQRASWAASKPDYAPKPRRAMKRAGKKTVEWDRVRKILNADYKRRGITTCEIRLSGCWVNNGLTHAHRMKRRFIVTEAEMMTTALACINCHEIIEAKSHQEMFEVVDSAIRRRSY